MRHHYRATSIIGLAILGVLSLSACQPDEPAPGPPGGPTSPGFPSPGCVDFDDHPNPKFIGTSFVDGSVIESRGAEIDFHDFVQNSGPPPVFYPGVAELQTAGLAGGKGNEFRLNNIAIDFHLHRELTNLSFKYFYEGGLAFLQVNGHTKLINDSFSTMGSIRGVTLTVSNRTLVTGGERATLTLTGKINGPVHVGGQELSVDDFCTQ